MEAVTAPEDQISLIPLNAPFPYMGGKSKIAPLVWTRLGNPPNYCEPFFGSGAMLLARPRTAPGAAETVNDLDSMISNFWRAVQKAPEEVARHADWIVSETDLHARHLWLVRRKAELTERLMADPEYFDAKAAGWWLWGICCWIGGGWCSGVGPWTEGNGRLVKGSGPGIKRQLPHLGSKGHGINRKLPHLGDKGRGINRQLPHLGDKGQGINRQLPSACKDRSAYILDLMRGLSTRLGNVRVCCGDWSRVLGPSPTTRLGLTAVFLDPPYSSERADNCYAEDSFTVANEVREWAIEHGDDPLLRIALCGYEGEHEMPASWSAFKWKASGGFGNQDKGRGRANSNRECLWFSPHCLWSRP